MKIFCQFLDLSCVKMCKNFRMYDSHYFFTKGITSILQWYYDVTSFLSEVTDMAMT